MKVHHKRLELLVSWPADLDIWVSEFGFHAFCSLAMDGGGDVVVQLWVWSKLPQRGFLSSLKTSCIHPPITAVCNNRCRHADALRKAKVQMQMVMRKSTKQRYQRQDAAAEIYVTAHLQCQGIAKEEWRRWLSCGQNMRHSWEERILQNCKWPKSPKQLTVQVISSKGTGEAEKIHHKSYWVSKRGL